MTSDDWVKIIGAGSAAIILILGAIERNYRGIRQTHELVNGRLGELLELSRKSGIAEERARRRRRAPPTEIDG